MGYFCKNEDSSTKKRQSINYVYKKVWWWFCPKSKLEMDPSEGFEREKWKIGKIKNLDKSTKKDQSKMSYSSGEL